MADALPREADVIPEVIADLALPDLVSHCAGPSPPSPRLPSARLTTSETVAPLQASPFSIEVNIARLLDTYLGSRAAGAASHQEWARMIAMAIPRSLAAARCLLEGLRGRAKSFGRGVARIIVLPCYLSYRLRAAFLGDRAFTASSHMLSLIPGLLGDYVRREF